MLSRWHPHEHPLQHLLDRREVGGVPDEVGAELPRAGSAERHVVAKDVVFDPRRVGDRVEVLVRQPIAGRIEFDVVELRAADDALLIGDRQLLPRGEIVQVLLHDDIAAASELRIFRTDERVVRESGADRVLSAIDEPQEVAGIEVTESRDLIDDRHVVTELAEQQLLQLEASIDSF